MGSRMAKHLVQAGHEVKVFNRSPEKAEKLIKAGASLASPSEMAPGVEVLITMLSEPQVIRQIATGPDGFLNFMPKGSTWMNTSTVDPSFAREMAALAQDKGIAYLDAPVAGTKGPAEKGELLFLLGGPSQIVDLCAPLTALMGKKDVHLGEVGMGSSMKMLINLLLAQSMWVFAEAMVLGEGMGLKQEVLLNVLLNAPVTPPFLANVRAKLETEDYEPNFPLKWIQKDLHLASLSAYDTQVPMPSMNLAKELYAQARQEGWGDKDFTSVYTYLREQAFKN